MYRKVITSLVIILTLALSLQTFIVRRVQALGANVIVNGSAETAVSGGGAPANWTKSSWGTNTPVYQYKTSGAQAGTKSLYVSVSGYVDGDAKWAFDQVAVKPNTQYVFTDYYKSNVATDVVAWSTNAAGEDSYLYLGTVAAKTDAWTKASYVFNTPADTAKLSVLHLIAANGYLWTDNYKLQEASQAVITNNVPNNSFEQVSDTNSNLPIAWNKQKWGTNNASFSYLSTGRTGTRSAKITISSYTSGDAKWVYDAQPAKPNALYTFTDYYKANVVTRVVAAIEMVDGSWNYIEMPTAPKSATTWVQYKGTFTMPANAKSYTVFHLLDKVGNLTVDDYAVSYQTIEPPVIKNGIPNDSVEQVSTDPTKPMGWTNGSWGTNTVQFEYLTNGHIGTRSIKTTITTYTDGDAKWYYDPQPVTPGTQLLFSDYYISNVASQVIVMLEMSDGSTMYVGLKNASPVQYWTQYTDSFLVPTGAVKATVLHLINSVGYLVTDDYSMTNYNPIGFARGLVSLTFDDGWEDNYDTALPKMQAYGFKSTQFYATTFIEGTGHEYKIKAFFDAGHEIGSHSVTHPDLRYVSSSQLTTELASSKQYLEGIVGTGNVKNFATPYGGYNDQVLAEIKKYYGSHRPVDQGFNAKDNFDRYAVKVQNVLKTTTTAEIQGWLQKAQQDKTWLILVYHRVASDPGDYDTYTTNFDQHLVAIKNSGLPVVTYQQALNEIYPQLQ